MTEPFYKIPAELWLEITSHFSTGDDSRSRFIHRPKDPRTYPSAKVDHNVVNLSSTCMSLRKALRDEVMCHLCLNLVVIDGELRHVTWPKDRSTVEIRHQYPLNMIPTGPHIRRLYLNVQVMPDHIPRKSIILDKVSGSFARPIRQLHNRVFPPRIAEFSASANYCELKTQAMEWAAPSINTMPNLQTLQLRALITSFMMGEICYIGPQCMDALTHLKCLENLHLGSLRIPENHGSLHIVRLSTEGSAPPSLNTFPRLKDLRFTCYEHPHGQPPLDAVLQLEVLHWYASDRISVDTFQESCLVRFHTRIDFTVKLTAPSQKLSRMEPKPKSALRELVIDARLQETHVVEIIRALAFADLTVFVYYGKWKTLHGFPNPSQLRKLARSVWPGLTTCLTGHDIDDIVMVS